MGTKLEGGEGWIFDAEGGGGDLERGGSDYFIFSSWLIGAFNWVL